MKLTGLVILSIALIAFFKVGLSGEVFIVDLLVVAGILFALLMHRSMFSQSIFWFSLGLTMYQAVLDLVLATDSELFSRALARNVTVTAHFAVLTFMATRWPRAFLISLFGFGVSLALFTILQPSFTSLVNPWKFGVWQGAFLAWVAASIYCSSKYLTSRNLVYPVVVNGGALILAYYCLINDSRTGLLIVLAALLFGVVFAYARRPRAWVLGVLGIAAVSVVPMLFALYFTAADQGLLGESAMQRAQYIQSTSSSDNQILQSRSQVFDSLGRIGESLPFGLGSFPEGYSVHSHVVGAIAETGLIGIAFWIFVIIVIIRSALRDSKQLPSNFYGIYLSLGASLVINILFSPLLGYQRVLTPLSFAAFVAFVPLVRGQLSSTNRLKSSGGAQPLPGTTALSSATAQPSQALGS